MEKRIYYIAGKTIEISTLTENNRQNSNVVIKFLSKNCDKEQIILKRKFKEDIFIGVIHDFIGKKRYFSTGRMEIEFKSSVNFQKFIQLLEPMLLNLSSKTFKNPYPAADTIIRYGNGIVLVYRKNPPSGWAIPGGFINYGESAEKAAIREAREETGLKIKNLKLFGVFSDPDRDPRFHTVSIVFTADGKGKLKAGDDASKVRIFTEKELPEDIAFDHKKILKKFFKDIKKDMNL